MAIIPGKRRGLGEEKHKEKIKSTCVHAAVVVPGCSWLSIELSLATG